MNLEAIIETLGKVLNKKFILLKQILPNPKFPLFNKYRLELYSKEGDTISKEAEYEEGYRNDEPDARDNIERQFLEMIFNRYINDGAK